MAFKNSLGTIESYFIVVKSGPRIPSCGIWKASGDINTILKSGAEYMFPIFVESSNGGVIEVSIRPERSDQMGEGKYSVEKIQERLEEQNFYPDLVDGPRQRDPPIGSGAY
jgi:hypothetical protein